MVNITSKAREKLVPRVCPTGKTTIKIGKRSDRRKIHLLDEIRVNCNELM